MKDFIHLLLAIIIALGVTYYIGVIILLFWALAKS